ncbi:MAG: PilZ domain-containing protein [Candidatus Omnitrophica bacterium]|nr:PilZ domain-containing protein [Candidatus Omnitrophota bacterium]
MFLIVGTVFLILLSITLMMLWSHEKIAIKRVVPHAKIEECWDGEDRRSHERFNKDLKVEYCVRKRPHLKNCRTVDLSKGGMKLLLDEKLPKGAIMSLKVSIPDNRRTIEVEAEVVWTNDADNKDPSGKRFFFSGLKFIAVKEPAGIHLSEYLSSLGSKG